MSHMSLGGTNPNEPPLAARFAHSYPAATAVLAGWGTVHAGPWWRTFYESIPFWLYALLGIPWMVSMFWFVLALACWRKHPMAVCVRCLTDMPNDGPVQVIRRDRRLRRSHRCADRAYQIRTVGVVVTALTISLLPWWSAKFIAALMLIGWWWNTVYDVLAARTHLRLAPWCPYCRGGGDDESGPEVAPTPDPAGTKVAT